MKKIQIAKKILLTIDAYIPYPKGIGVFASKNKARKIHNKLFTTPIPALERFSYVCWFKEEEPITWVNNDSLLCEYQSINFEEFKNLFRL